MTDQDRSEAGSAPDEVRRAVGRFARAIAKFDADAVVAVCDSEAEHLVYQPEELDAPVLGIGALREYVRDAPSMIRPVEDVVVVDSSIEVDGDVAIAYYRSWARIRLAESGEAIDGQVRQSFIFRKRADGWKLWHYHESRQAAEFRAVFGR